MNKLLKWILIGIGAFAGLLAAAAIAAVLLVDPNDYKDDIQRAVQEKTGRTLRIDGRLSLRLFPWIGVELPALQFSNAPGFGDEPMAAIKSAGVRVKLLPLLTGRVSVKRVTLDGLTLRLVKLPNGRANWEGLAGKSTPARDDKKPAASPSPKTGAPLALGAIAITGADISWDDRQTNNKYRLRDLTLVADDLGSTSPDDVRLAFGLDTGRPLKLPVELQGRLALDLPNETLRAPQLALRVGGLQLKLQDFAGERLLSAPTLRGKLDLPAFDLRALLAAIGQAPALTDKSALTRVGLTAGFHAGAGAIELKNLVATLDDTTLKGELTASRFSAPRVRASLAIDTLDIDRYLAPAAPANDKKAKPAAPKPAPVVLPLALLRGADVEARLSVQSLKAMGMRTTDLRTALTAKNGVLRLGPTRAKLYGGEYQGDVTIDARSNEAQLRVNESLARVQLGELLKDMQLYNHFTGTAEVKLALSARGNGPDAIRRTLAGDVKLAVRNGQILGADFLKMADKIRSLADKLKGGKETLRGASGEATGFDSLTATAKITNGVAENSDLLLTSKELRASGRGRADLVRETLDVRLTLARPTDANQPCKDIPLRVSGPFAALSYTPDWEALAKCQGKRQIKRSLDKALDRLIKRKK